MLSKKTLVTGWFSFPDMGATAGDLMVRDQVCEWLTQNQCQWDIATVLPFEGGIDWRKVDPNTYSRLIFVCGPAGACEPINQLINRFAHCRIIGINLSMIAPVDEWNPFDVLFERDSSNRSRPDLAFITPTVYTPVAGVVLVHPQPEYGDRGKHERAEQVIRNSLARREVAAVHIDTGLESNKGGLRSRAEIESLIARMDLILTTRLHGTVLALKHGVPVIAIDPISGGAKIRRQTEAIQWPLVFDVDRVTEEELLEAYDYCLTKDAAKLALECSERAKLLLAQLQEEFFAELNSPPLPAPERISLREEEMKSSTAQYDRLRRPLAFSAATVNRLLHRGSLMAKRWIRS